MESLENNAAALQKHVTGTYLSLRVGVAVIGIALPVLLWLSDAGSLRTSMSDYYYSPMRNPFVGVLVAVGVCLYLYRGFSRAEDWALNVAGIFAVIIALAPERTGGEPWGVRQVLHVIAGVSFFLAIAYVCWFRSSDTLSLVNNTETARRLQKIYIALGVLLLASPLAALAVTGIRWYRDQRIGPANLVFFLEAFALWVFGAYWLVKSGELYVWKAEKLTLAGRVKIVSTPKPKGSRTPGRLVVVPDGTEAAFAPRPEKVEGPADVLPIPPGFSSRIGAPTAG